MYFAALSRIDEAVQRLHSDIDLARKIVERHTQIPKERLDITYCATAATSIMTPEETVEFGLAQEVVELNEMGSVQSGTAFWTV